MTNHTPHIEFIEATLCGTFDTLHAIHKEDELRDLIRKIRLAISIPTEGEFEVLSQIYGRPQSLNRIEEYGDLTCGDTRLLILEYINNQITSALARAHYDVANCGWDYNYEIRKAKEQPDHERKLISTNAYQKYSQYKLIYKKSIQMLAHIFLIKNRLLTDEEANTFLDKLDILELQCLVAGIRRDLIEQSEKEQLEDMLLGLSAPSLSVLSEHLNIKLSILIDQVTKRDIAEGHVYDLVNNIRPLSINHISNILRKLKECENKPLQPAQVYALVIFGLTYEQSLKINASDISMIKYLKILFHDVKISTLLDLISDCRNDITRFAVLFNNLVYTLQSRQDPGRLYVTKQPWKSISSKTDEEILQALKVIGNNAIFSASQSTQFFSDRDRRARHIPEPSQEEYSNCCTVS